MNDQRTNNSAAFPSTSQEYNEDGHVEFTTEIGMTLRDYFAAKAMNAIWGGYHYAGSTPTLNPEKVAAKSYEIADAMLKARES